MNTSYSVQKSRCRDRISQKTLDTTFLRQLEKGVNCPPFVSNAILETAKRIYQLDDCQGMEKMKPGQMKVVGIIASEPAGKRLSECQTKECVVTFFNGPEDNEVRFKFGTTGLRRAKLLRIATEAWEQGILLSQEDLAYNILHCSQRTIARDIKHFREKNIVVPTRGQQLDIGPGLSHKVMAVERLIQGQSEVEIARRIFHSLSAIERYTVTFVRVALLTQKGFGIEDIAFVVQISTRLVEQYQNLYKTYRTVLKHNQRFQILFEQTQEIDHYAISFLKKKQGRNGE